MDQRRSSGLRDILHHNTVDSYSPSKHFLSLKNDKSFLQRMKLERNIEVHSGCVNTISWSSDGQYILSGSDDQHLCVTDAFENRIRHKIKTSHAANIFSAKFMPASGDSKVISCSAQGRIIYTDLERSEATASNIFDCVQDAVYDIVTIPNDPYSFLTCSHDKTVRWYDLRIKDKCPRSQTTLSNSYYHCMDDILLTMDCPVTALSVCPRNPWQFAIGKSDSIISIYDRRKLGTRSLGLNQTQPLNSLVTQFAYRGYKSRNRITSLVYNSIGDQLLASYSWDNIYLFDLNQIQSERAAQALSTSDLNDSSADTSRKGFKRFRTHSGDSDTSSNSSEHIDPLFRDLPSSPSRSSASVTRRVSTLHDFIVNLRSELHGNSTSGSEQQPNTSPQRVVPRQSNVLRFQQFLNSRRSNLSVPSTESMTSQRQDYRARSDVTIQPQPSSAFSQASAQAFRQELNNRRESPTTTESSDTSTSPSIPVLPSSVLQEQSSQNYITLESDISTRPSRSLHRLREYYDTRKQMNCFKPDPHTHMAKNFLKFTGHRNQKTVIKEADFWGDRFIMSGSDCGHVLFWSIDDQKPVMMLRADRSVVNCVQAHPTAPILASSGIDCDIKLFSPISSKCEFRPELMEELIDRNIKAEPVVTNRFVLHLFASLGREERWSLRNAFPDD